MAKSAWTSVDAYLAAQPDSVRSVLDQVRAAIVKAVPDAQEVISYQIPAYKLDGAPVIYFAGWKEHYSLYPASAGLVAVFRKDLTPYKISKGTIRFPLSQPVPARLIERIVKFRAKEVAERKDAWKKPAKLRAGRKP